LRLRLSVEDGDRKRLGRARQDARVIANHAFAMRRLGYSQTEICDRISLRRLEFLENNAQAVVRKACDAYDGYEAALDQWQASDDRADRPKPQPPATDGWGAFPLVMAHGEGYRLECRDDDRIGFRISPQPYNSVTGVVRGRQRDLRRLQAILAGESDWNLGRGEVLYRDGVYYLHVAVTTTTTLQDPADAETIIGVDVNERNVAVTALDRETRDTVVRNHFRQCGGNPDVSRPVRYHADQQARKELRTTV
jgi:putative transposase